MKIKNSNNKMIHKLLKRYTILLVSADEPWPNPFPVFLAITP